jgi:hypothetical protein
MQFLNRVEVEFGMGIPPYEGKTLILVLRAGDGDEKSAVLSWLHF